MDPEMINEVVDILVDRLGPAGLHLYEVYVRQQVIAWWGGFWVAVGVVAVASIGVSVAVKKGLPLWVKGYDDRSKEEDAWSGIFLAAAVIPGAIAAVALLVLGNHLANISQILNPEFHAIQVLLGR